MLVLVQMEASFDKLSLIDKNVSNKNVPQHSRGKAGNIRHNTDGRVGHATPRHGAPAGELSLTSALVHITGPSLAV